MLVHSGVSRGAISRYRHPHQSVNASNSGNEPQEVDHSAQPLTLLPAREWNAIQTLMERCRYGLVWHWLKTPKLQAVVADDFNQIDCRNVRGSCGPEPRIEGDCAQLAFQVRQQLSNALGDQYRFYQASGNFKDSPWGRHYFVVGWPTAQDSVYRASLLDHDGQILQGTIVVDPTYRRVGVKVEQGPDSIESYYVGMKTYRSRNTLKRALDLSEDAPDILSSDLSFKFDDTGKTMRVPLGFMRDLAPNHPERNAVVTVGFRRKKQTGLPALKVMLLRPAPSNSREALPWKKSCFKKTPLRQALTKLQDAIAPSWQEKLKGLLFWLKRVKLAKKNKNTPTLSRHGKRAGDWR